MHHRIVAAAAVLTAAGLFALPAAAEAGLDPIFQAVPKQPQNQAAPVHGLRRGENRIVEEKIQRQRRRQQWHIEQRIDRETDAAVDGVVDGVLDSLFD